MEKFRTWLRVAAAGWILTALFGVIVFAMKGNKELVASVVLIVVGLLMSWWLLARQSRAALIVSLVIGTLQLLEQVAYSVADFGDKHLAIGTASADVLGAVAAVVIVLGSVMGLVTRRQVATSTMQPANA